MAYCSVVVLGEGGAFAVGEALRAGIGNLRLLIA